MRAAFMERATTLTVREAPVPEPGPGEVRLKVRYCGICGSDLSVYKTGALAGPNVVMGHEIVAEVDLDPSGRWPTGSRVVPFPARGCGRCHWCREGQPRYCVQPPFETWGGYAEYAVYAGTSLLPIPDDLDDRAAALAEPFGVALRAVELARPNPGEVAYVSGLGPIGLLSVAALAASGSRVVAADPKGDRRSLAADLGAELVLENTREDPFAATMALDEHGARVGFECAGVGDSLAQVLDTCGPGGTIAILGVPMAPAMLLRMFVREFRAFSIAGPSLASMERALRLLRLRPEVAKVVTGEVPLEGIDEAFHALVEGTGGIKVLVAPHDRA
jgi:threonine dehydrogenase-like Zn-dependent dehydrogenase